MMSLPKSDLGAKTQPSVKLHYAKLTNPALHVARVAKCCHNLHVVISLHRSIKDSIGKSHHVTVCSQRLTLQCRKLRKNNVTKLLDAYQQGRTEVMLPDMWGFAEPLLRGFGCVTTQKALETDQGQVDREIPAKPNIDTSG